MSELAADLWARLRAATPARIALGRTGASLPTGPVLNLQLAHARARDAVHDDLETAALATALGDPASRVLRSRAPDRASYLQRPDLGRRLASDSATGLTRGEWDLAVVVADGLSARATRHAPPLLRALFEAATDLRIAPPLIALQARVALADEIGALLGARLVVILLGERPGLSAPDSLGAYLTYAPAIGRRDSERNCISNIRPGGLSSEAAAGLLLTLIRAALVLRATGVALKASDAPLQLGASA